MAGVLVTQLVNHPGLHSIEKKSDPDHVQSSNYVNITADRKQGQPDQLDL